MGTGTKEQIETEAAPQHRHMGRGHPQVGQFSALSPVSGRISTAQSPVNTVPRVHSSAVELHVMHTGSAAGQRPQAGPTTQ